MHQYFLQNFISVLRHLWYKNKQYATQGGDVERRYSPHILKRIMKGKKNVAGKFSSIHTYI